jgi:tetratricopeptide (TPR) repeat protein
MVTVIVCVIGSISVGFTVEPSSKEEEEEAYRFNRTGMIDMSQALFEEAIVEFKKAAALVSDYQLRGRPLLYTPNFMAAWAYEKIGRRAEACEYYGKFLKLAPPDLIEATKAEHAKEYLESCPH